MVTGSWRADLEHRTAEAVALLGSVPGVTGLVIAGSVGRGEPWPLSDVDLIVVYDDALDGAAAAEFERRRGLLEQVWSWSGVPASLDTGPLAFTAAEVAEALAAPPVALATRMADRRWFHAVDKAWAGRAAPASDPLIVRFAALVTAARFTPEVVAARRERWRHDAGTALAEARDHLAGARRPAATAALQRAVEAAIEVLTEEWGERSGSLGRRWSRFERLARRHDAVGLGDRLLAIGAARPRDVRPRLAAAPWWLHRRIDLALRARRLIGEPVNAEQNARDQLLAFALLWSRRELPARLWSTPPPQARLGHALDELDEILDTVGGSHAGAVRRSHR